MSAQSEELVRAVSHRVVEEVSPERIELFAILAPTYLADPDRVRRQREDKEEPLAFGVGAAETIFIAAVVYTVNGVVSQILARFTDAAISHGKRRWPWQRTAKANPIAVSRALSPEDAQYLRQVAAEKAKETGLEEAVADKIAEAIIDALVVLCGLAGPSTEQGGLTECP